MRFSSRHQLPRRQMWMVVCAALFWLHTGTAPAAAQTAADRTRILALANRGAAAEAWSAWTALPNTQARTRFGIEIAIALKDVFTRLKLRYPTGDPALFGLKVA